MKKNKLNYVFLTLTICVMGLIFYFSSQNGTSSGNSSGGIVDFIITDVLHISQGSAEYENIYYTMSFIVRKSAHLSIFASLGLCACLTIINFDWKKIKKFLLSLLFVFLYACTDEIHQIFVVGRDGKFTDVLIDSFGGCIGCLIGIAIGVIIFKSKKKKELLK